MIDLWSRFERWLSTNAPPEVLASLGGPASDAAIAALEAKIGAKLSEDVLASYRLHDGQAAGGEPPGLIDCRELLSIARIDDEWSVWKDLLDRGTFVDARSRSEDGSIRADWWHPLWIPLTYDGSGNHDCLDLAPVAGVQAGRMIRFWHDDAERTVLAPSFRAWFADFVEACERGENVYSDDYGGIVSLDDA